jgi:hypothetical protein
VSVPEDMRTDVMDAGHLRSVVPSPPHVSCIRMVGVQASPGSQTHTARSICS